MFRQSNLGNPKGSAESGLSDPEKMKRPSSGNTEDREPKKNLLNEISRPVNLSDESISAAEQNFLTENLKTAKSGTDIQEVLKALDNITPNNYSERYLHADYSRLTNNSSLNDFLLREKDEGKLGYALRKFIYSKGSDEKLAEKLGTLFNQLSYGTLSEDQAQKALIIQLITKDLENGIYAGIANKASGDKFSSKSGDYLKTMKALGSLDILIERAEINNATPFEKGSLKKLTKASATVLFNEIRDQYTYLQLNNQLPNDQLKIARGLKIIGLNVPESTPMAVINLVNIINKDADRINHLADRDYPSFSDSLIKASQLVDLIQEVETPTSINSSAHVEPTKEALIKLVGSFNNRSGSSGAGDLFNRENDQDARNFLKVFSFIYDNDKYPSTEAILNTKQAFVRDIKQLVTLYKNSNSLSEGAVNQINNFQEKIDLLSTSGTQKNLLERSQQTLNRLGEIVDELVANRGNSQNLLQELQTKLIQSQVILKSSVDKRSETESSSVNRNATIEDLINNSRKNGGANMFPVSDLKESWQMLLTLQRVVKYLNSDEGVAKIKANLSPESGLRNIAGDHLQDMIQELMTVNENVANYLVSEEKSLHPFGENLKAEDIELINQIYPKLTRSNQLASLNRDEPSLVLNKLNEKFCQTLNNREINNEEKKSLIRAYVEFFLQQICTSTQTGSNVSYSLKENYPRFLINRDVANDWSQMKTFQRLPNYFKITDPMKRMSQEILTMISLVILGKPNFINDLISTEKIWSKNEDGQNKSNIKAEDLRLLARLYALYTKGFKPQGENNEKQSQYITDRNQSLTRLKDKIVGTLSKYPNLIIEEMPSFQAVLKDCFMKQDQSLSNEDFGYTQDFISLVGKAFDPDDNSIEAVY
ncbi:MAG: hypothetical protein ACKO3R_08745 [bacterium]